MRLENTRLEYAFRDNQVVVPGQSFTIRNSGSSHAFDWTAEATEAWIILGATSGTADAQAQSVSVRVDPYQLDPGVHEGSIIVRGEQVQGGVQTVRVIATVIGTEAPVCSNNKSFDVLKAPGVSIRAYIEAGALQPNGHCAVTGRMSIHNLLKEQGSYPFTGELDAQGQLAEVALPASASLTLDLAGGHTLQSHRLSAVGAAEHAVMTVTKANYSIRRAAGPPDECSPLILHLTYNVVLCR